MAKAEKAEKAQLSDGEREAFQEIFDLLIPEDFRILSYDKKRVIRSLMKIIEDDLAIIRLRMIKVIKLLKKAYEEEVEA